MKLPSSAECFRAALLEWESDHYRPYPWRRGDASVYETFIAEFFLTQTPSDNVAAVYPDFLARFDSLSAIDATPTEELREVIEPLGFQNMRSEAVKEIGATHDRLPRSVKELTQLPRVGEYVANTTLCLALSRSLPVVDRNVNRVYSRVFGEAYPNSHGDRRTFATRMLPTDGKRARKYNMALLDFGALNCTKQPPACDGCVARVDCRYVKG